MGLVKFVCSPPKGQRDFSKSPESKVKIFDLTLLQQSQGIHMKDVSGKNQLRKTTWVRQSSGKAGTGTIMPYPEVNHHPD